MRLEWRLNFRVIKSLLVASSHCPTKLRQSQIGQLRAASELCAHFVVWPAATENLSTILPPKLNHCYVWLRNTLNLSGTKRHRGSLMPWNRHSWTQHYWPFHSRIDPASLIRTHQTFKLGACSAKLWVEKSVTLHSFPECWMTLRETAARQDGSSQL